MREHQKVSAGKLIESARIEKGLTMTKAAYLAKMSLSTFSLAEKGSEKHPSTYDTIFKIAKALELDPLVLIELSPHLDVTQAPEIALIKGESKDPKVVLARRVKELRKTKGMTQKDVRRKINMSEIRFSHMELGRYMPNELKLRELADVLETTIDYLKGQSEY
ncbi:helix-turn-helix domain-containing protein [Paenibacillus sp. 276b]|uniref:helix-turn-helix domain-containing protein n=1 Tax=Paenibacillus sp. 276b TaxID=1566277 RepID=UPI000896B413|nr:helix-turn-helix transcriptional regulator [Paenibacillus sp. 276b]SEB27507.1 DNA-binding transcriptional regulator, XRE-family HTH domain [Paenibacillus sp. 276b]